MKKKSLKIASVCALAGVIAIGGVMAYFTDADTATNTFTVGKVSIDLQEPDWVPPTDIVPEQEFAKDPQIKNDGINDAYVFVKVTVPYANVVTANDDGTKNAAADTELFNYDVKAGWVELTDKMVKDEDAKTVTHLYAYATGNPAAMTAVASGVTTDSIFDYIQFANIVEDQNIEGTTLDVVVDGYAIQTTNINDGKTALDGNNADGKTSPADVWSVIEKQAPATAQGSEEVNTDIKNA